jgi:hypothetical protein
MAIGVGGMTGMSSVLAVDPTTVTIGGTVVDDHGTPLRGVGLVFSEELPPDGGLAAFQATTGPDGTFSVDVYAWGTAAAPASLSIKTAPDAEVVVIGTSCSQTWTVALDDDRQVAFADAAPESMTLTAATTLLGEVCGETGAPGGKTGNGGSRGLTPPPTDTSAAATEGPSDRVGPALTIGFLVGLLAAAALLLPRRRVRPQD